MHRVVITGMGCISALGPTVADHLRALREGRCAIRPITRVPPERLTTRIAAEVTGYDPAAHFTERQAATLDRYAQFAVVAARAAVADAGLRFDAALAAETAVVMATGAGGIGTLDEGFHRLYAEGKPRLHPMTIPKMMVSAATSHITMEFGLTGPAFTVSSACSSSNHALGEAYWMIRSGRAVAALAGGAEASIVLGPMRAWEALRVMAPDACRPFSADRRGMVVGEGAGVVVLEPLEAAVARGATIHAELAGFGASADAGDLVQPSETGAAAAIARALACARLDPSEIDYVNAHGTGTDANDATETRAIRRVFGAEADRLAVSSTKSMHGHALGAAGALELIATVMAVRDGVIPPTVNYRVPDPECDLDVVPNQARERPVRAALSNAFAFGGLNAVLAVRRAG